MALTSKQIPELAIDLGTSRTRIAVRGGGVVCDIPSAIALRGREVVASGEAAARMQGRSPAGVEVIRPVREAAVTDFHAAEKLLAAALQQVGTRGLRKPRVLLAIGREATEVERRAAMESARAAGARDVTVVDRLVAAAVGVELPVEEPTGHLVVDIGAGGTRAAILSLAGIVVHRAAPVGGDALNRAIQDWLRDARGIIVEDRTAENLKHHLVDITGTTTRQIRIRGRDLSRERPVEEAVSSGDLNPALEPLLKRMRDVVGDVLRRASPELSADLLERGLVLCGGGSALNGIDEILRADTGLAVLRPEQPELAVMRGCLTLLENPDRYAALVLGQR